MIRQAAHKPKGSIERLLLVAAFAQSAFQAVGKLKCMVPMMGETYEVCAGIFFSMMSQVRASGVICWCCQIALEAPAPATQRRL